MMYKTTIPCFMAALLLVALTAHAETQAGPGRHKGFHGGRMFESLQLSETQETEIKNLFASSRENLRPLHQQLRELGDLLRSVAESQPFNETQVRYQAQELARVQAELMVARAALMSQVSGLLTPEQRAQWKNLREQRKQRFKEKFEGRRNHPQVQPG